MTALTTPALLELCVDRFGEREALVDRSPDTGDVRIGFSELSARAQAVARALIAQGIEAGDRVAIWAPNIWEWPVTLLGIHLAGAVVVPLNTRYKGAEAAYILEASGAKTLFTVEGFLGNDYVSMLGANAPATLHNIVVLRGDVPSGAVSCDAFVASGTAISMEELDVRMRGVTSDSVADILFTSGTTGAPKGVVCTHGQTVRAFQDWADIVGLKDEDRYLIVNPFFHAFGYKAGIVACLHSGATMVTEPVFDVAKVIASIESEHISMLPGPPTLYQTILNDASVDRSSLATLRLAVTGAAVVPVSLIEAMRDDLGFETVITGYGLTEACGIAAMCRHDDDAETIAAYSGRAIPGVELLIADEHGKEVPRGDSGEVLVRGYNVMKEYFNNPEQTAETIDPHGWLHTGDIGVMNDAGYIKITDRIKDMFIVGGFNAYPAEIESLISAHSDVAQVSVVGVADERMGEVGYAFVIPATGAHLEVESLRAWCREAMANYKVPRYFEFVSELPLNASGKVLKFELRERARAKVDA